MSHTTGFISMKFLSVFDGAGLAGWEWNTAAIAIKMMYFCI